MKQWGQGKEKGVKSQHLTFKWGFDSRGAWLVLCAWDLGTPFTIHASSGARGSGSFANDRDRLRFLELLDESHRRASRWRFAVFGLTGNHVHLVAQTHRPKLETTERRKRLRGFGWMTYRGYAGFRAQYPFAYKG